MFLFRDCFWPDLNTKTEYKFRFKPNRKIHDSLYLIEKIMNSSVIFAICFFLLKIFWTILHQKAPICLIGCWYKWKPWQKLMVIIDSKNSKIQIVWFGFETPHRPLTGRIVNYSLVAVLNSFCFLLYCENEAQPIVPLLSLRKRQYSTRVMGLFWFSQEFCFFWPKQSVELAHKKIMKKPIFTYTWKFDFVLRHHIRSKK